MNTSAIYQLIVEVSGRSVVFTIIGGSVALGFGLLIDLAKYNRMLAWQIVKQSAPTAFAINLVGHALCSALSTSDWLALYWAFAISLHFMNWAYWYERVGVKFIEAAFLDPAERDAVLKAVRLDESEFRTQSQH